MYERTITKTINKISKSFPVLLLTGPRQVGKTTILENCAKKNRRYVTLDNLDDRKMAQNDPALFLQTYQPPLIIDEVQYALQLFSYIKIAVDRRKNKKDKNGMFWLTGSQKFHLMKGVTESLAGRSAIIDLLGFSQAEIDNRANKCIPFLPDKKWLTQARKNAGDTKSLNTALNATYKQIWRGSFPKVNVDKKELTRQQFYSSYVQTYLQRDVKDVLKISDETAFYNFLSAELKGLTEDPRKAVYQSADKMGYPELKKFHAEFMANKPYAYCIVASEKKINMDDVKKCGDVKKLSLEEIFGY